MLTYIYAYIQYHLVHLTMHLFNFVACTHTDIYVVKRWRKPWRDIDCKRPHCIRRSYIIVCCYTSVLQQLSTYASKQSADFKENRYRFPLQDFKVIATFKIVYGRMQLNEFLKQPERRYGYCAAWENLINVTVLDSRIWEAVREFAQSLLCFFFLFLVESKVCGCEVWRRIIALFPVLAELLYFAISTKRDIVEINCNYKLYYPLAFLYCANRNMLKSTSNTPSPTPLNCDNLSCCCSCLYCFTIRWNK